MLHNSVNVMTRQRDELGIREYPLYTHDEVDDSRRSSRASNTTAKSSGRRFTRPRAGLPRRRWNSFDAGHTLGSAGILIRGKKETLFYTGDVCFHDQTILRARRGLRT